MKRLTNLLTLPRRKRPPVGTTPADVVWEENKWRLLRYRPRPEGIAFDTPLLMVPSLINRHYVLDLMPGKSLADWLVDRGHEVYCIDWGTPGPEDRYLTFDTICDDYLARALRVAGRDSKRGKPHVLGYCLGGTLAAIHAAAHPHAMAGLIALAAPVAFDDDGLLTSWTRTRTFDVSALVRAAGNVPWQLMQGAFHLLRPTMNLSKGAHLIDRAWDDEFLDGFLALETWGNDNVSFPGAAYERYIRDLYRGDQFSRGDFALSGRPARLEDIVCPLLAVTFQHDGIVPWQSAAPLVDRAASVDKERLHLPGGHVGAVVSKKASRGLWPALSNWLIARDQPAAPAKAAAPSPKPTERRANKAARRRKSASSSR